MKDTTAEIVKSIRKQIATILVVASVTAIAVAAFLFSSSLVMLLLILCNNSYCLYTPQNWAVSCNVPALTIYTTPKRAQWVIIKLHFDYSRASGSNKVIR